VHLLAPHHQNFNKRLVKTPKLYFLDTGLAIWLLGIQNTDPLGIHDHGTHLSPLEIKSGRTINRDYFKGLELWKKLAGESAGQPLVYGGDEPQTRSWINLLPWSDFDADRLSGFNRGLSPIPRSR